MVWDDSGEVDEVTVGNGGEPAGKVGGRPGGIIRRLYRVRGDHVTYKIYKI